MTIFDFAILCCENFDKCEDCPVMSENADKRTIEDKSVYYVTCQEQLANWILEQAKKELS